MLNWFPAKNEPARPAELDQLRRDIGSRVEKNILAVVFSRFWAVFVPASIVGGLIWFLCWLVGMRAESSTLVA